MPYCSNVEAIVKHLDKVISLISKDASRGIYSKTIRSYSEVSSRLEIIQDMCNRILSSEEGIVTKPGVDLISWQKFLVLRSQERMLIDKLIDSLYDKNLIDLDDIDRSDCSEYRQDNISSNSDNLESYVPEVQDKQEQKTVPKDSYGKEKECPYSFHNIRIKEDNELDRRKLSKYRCSVDEVDTILKNVYENCRDTNTIRLYEAMYLWFHCRYVENPCPQGVNKYYGLNSISTWLCFLVVRYVHECSYDRYSNFVQVIDSWMQSISDNPSNPFGTPPFMTKKSLRKIRVDMNMISEMDTKWRSFCNLFNRCSSNNNYSSKLDPNLMINKLEDPEALGIIER